MPHLWAGPVIVICVCQSVLPDYFSCTFMRKSSFCYNYFKGLHLIVVLGVCTYVCIRKMYYLVYFLPQFPLEAVHRFYESRRCLFNDEQPSRCHKAEELKRRCKKIGYKKKVRFIHIRSTFLVTLLVPYFAAV